MKKSVVWKVLIAFMLLMTGYGGLQAEKAAACSCVEPKEAREELAESAVVFAGRVLKIEGDQVHFDVATLWRGPQQRQITVMNPQNNSCRYPFKEGEEYVVYARGTEQKPEASLCSRTVSVHQAADELQALGNPVYNPAGEAMNRVEQEKDLSVWYVGLAAALFILMAALVYSMFRRKRT